MANASHDNNGVSTLIGVLNTNGTTITPVKGNTANHAIVVNDGATGSDFGPAQATFDDNHRSIAMAVSNTDGQTPVALYVDSSGALLVKST